MGQSAIIAHFVAFFISFQNILTLKLGQTGVIGESKTYYLLVTVSQIFIKNLLFLPQNDL
jgi:hypothetical protein